MAVPAVVPSTSICIVQCTYLGLDCCCYSPEILLCYVGSYIPLLCTSTLETHQLFTILSYINHNQFLVHWGH
jgi:hypothetical protein